MLKRSLLVLLTFILALSVFSACSGNAATDETIDSPPIADEPTAEADVPDEPEDTATADNSLISNEDEAASYLTKNLEEVGYDMNEIIVIAESDYGDAWFGDYDVWYFTITDHTTDGLLAVTYDGEIWDYDFANDVWSQWGVQGAEENIYSSPNLKYREEIIVESDPGDYMSAEEGANYVFDVIRDIGFLYDGYTDYTMVLFDIAAVSEDGDECYFYWLYVEEPEQLLLDTYAYSYQSGEIYIETNDGKFDLFIHNDPFQTSDEVFYESDDVVNWWGTYNLNEFEISISNYNGESITFEFFSNRKTITYGTALVDSEEEHHAQYGDFEFWLSDDEESIMVFSTIGSEYEYLGGEYIRE